MSVSPIKPVWTKTHHTHPLQQVWDTKMTAPTSLVDIIGGLYSEVTTPGGWQLLSEKAHKTLEFSDRYSPIPVKYNAGMHTQEGMSRDRPTRNRRPSHWKPASRRPIISVNLSTLPRIYRLSLSVEENSLVRGENSFPSDPGHLLEISRRRQLCFRRPGIC